MPDNSQKTPRRAATGSYKRPAGTASMPAGAYPRRRPDDKTRAIPSEDIRRQSGAPRRRVLTNDEKMRFDFKELFSKKNMKRFSRHVVFYMILVTISLVLAGGIIFAANDIAAFVKEERTIVVNVPKGASASQIAELLAQNDVISSSAVFKAYCKFKKSDGFQSGEHELNSAMSYKEIISELKVVAEKRKTAKITIPEGYEQQEIIDLLVEKGYADRKKLEAAMNEQEYDYAFLKDLPERNNRLEGYLFPDTYEIYVGDEVSIVNTMLKNFESKMKSDEVAALIESSKYSLDEIITMASIVEREGADESEFANVAGVFYNRLNSKTYPYLESCATVQYILPERKAVLSIADTKTDNPYNTYKYKGLPPGPISCPGLAAIKAALKPAQTDYYFFVASEEGTLFAKTYAQHLVNVKRAGNSTGGTSTVS